MSGWQIFSNARTGDHAAIAGEDDIGKTESIAELIDLGRDGLGIGGVAVKHLDRDGASLGIGEQAKDDLQFTGLIVAGVAELGKRTVAAFEVGGG